MAIINWTLGRIQLQPGTLEGKKRDKLHQQLAFVRNLLCASRDCHALLGNQRQQPCDDRRQQEMLGAQARQLGVPTVRVASPPATFSF